MKLRFSLAGIIFAASFALAAEPTTKKSLQSDPASRFQHVHRLPLLDGDGKKITPESTPPVQPFSLRTTCLKCHDYSKVSGGWHFNAPDPSVPAGRPGQPSLLVDGRTGTQLPLSYRKWPGTYRPDEIGMSPWAFALRFSDHTPGGGAGERLADDDKDPKARWSSSGKLEVNCLACHSAEPNYDHTQYLVQIALQNFIWAPAACSGMAEMKGSTKAMPEGYDPAMGPDSITLEAAAPRIVYDKNRFDNSRNVFFNLTANIKPERCYFCHSEQAVGAREPKKWMTDGDVHVARGMNCVTCHRNDINHRISRNYEGEVADRGAASEKEKQTLSGLTCRGCHMGNNSTPGGRLAAPVPAHAGLPAVHLEKLACTACHSGPYPQQTPSRVQTSAAHAIEFHGPHRGENVAPYIQEPVYLKQADGKLAPCRIVWPAFWGTMRDRKVTPLSPEAVEKLAGAVLNPEGDPNAGPANADRVKGTLAEIQKTLADKEAKAVYISAGRLYRLGGTFFGEDHPAAKPYAWPVGHDVRPAKQALGANQRCTDCHAKDSAFLFGAVTPEGLFELQSPTPVSMATLAEHDVTYHQTFALAFYLRPALKWILAAASLVLAAVLLSHGLAGLRSMLRRDGSKSS